MDIEKINGTIRNEGLNVNYSVYNSETSERIVLRVPMNLSAIEFARLCGIDEHSAAYEAVEDALPAINRFGAPKAVIRWANVDSVNGDVTTIEGISFHSKVVADKLHGIPRVFLSVVTAGEELDTCDDLEDDPFLDIFKGALLQHGMMYVVQFMQERFGFDGSSRLNPGSLPDWLIGNNFALFDMIGGLDEIGVSLNAKGYIHPWNSASQIQFPGNGYENCSLCKKYDCIRRRASFDHAEYRRVFGIDP